MRTMESIITDATFRLPDGRTIAYAEYGDPAGKPVLLMHGFPDSRITATRTTP